MHKKAVANIPLRRYLTSDNYYWLKETTKLLKRSRRKTESSHVVNAAVSVLRTKSSGEIEKLIRAGDDRLQKSWLVFFRPENVAWLDRTVVKLDRLMGGVNDSRLVNAAVTALRTKSLKEIERLVHQQVA